jgi:D-lactate dehydrogenase
MCCGVAQNSYHTLESLAVLLADGALVDTARPDADLVLARERPALHAALRALRDEVRGHAALSARIRRKFAGKNTTGYSLNAFLDFERPADILAHLMVGSEGTLGFVAEATLRTVPVPPACATGLVFFADLREAGAAVFPLAAAGADALEIMDAASLRSQADEREYPFAIEARTAALLAEFRAPDEAALAARLAGAEAALRPFPLLAPVRFTRDPAEREAFWKLRKGLAPRVGAMRPSGTAFLTEDVAVPVGRLAEAIADFQALFERCRFPDAITFGHAKDGNLHFVLSADVGRPEAIARYAEFMRRLVDLVVGKYDGAIKAEHGSGRNMAPFVRAEWGDEAYAVMRRVKSLLDPSGVLNPGVVLNDDPQVHVKDLKALPSISPLADRCIECGFCEPRCPSRDLTLTPRQRIVVTRELTRLAAASSADAQELRDALAADFVYEGIATCAGDSMCQTSCPVRIDTGALMKELKAARRGRAARLLAAGVARSFGAVAAAARLGLGAAAALRALGLGRWLSPEVTLPRPAPALPQPRPVPSPAGRVVYFPSCLTRVLGPLPGEKAPPLARSALDLFLWAGLEVRYPRRAGGLCCGMPFLSKAFPEAAAEMAARVARSLWEASSEGRDPVVTDASPCAGTLQEHVVPLLAGEGRRIRVYDFASFWAREVLPRRDEPPRRPGTAVLHPTCTLVKSGGLEDLLRVARAHREKVVVPATAECCGFAGDRGFLLPELTASATRTEAAEVRELVENGGADLYSTCRTCEIGMSRAVGIPFGSIIHLVHEAVTAADRGR